MSTVTVNRESPSGGSSTLEGGSMSEKYGWRHGDNGQQEYYEAYIGKRCVMYVMRTHPYKSWYACVDNGQRGYDMLWDRGEADKERKRQGLDKHAPHHMLSRQTPLQSTGHDFMIRMAEEAYETGEREFYVVRTGTGKGL